MTDVLIVGDGPAGLSAALFLAKNEMSVKVFGQDQTLMHKAVVYNYLGIPDITGSEFQKISRQQVEKFGAELLEGEVNSVEKGASGFTVQTDDSVSHKGEYLILATGPSNPLAESLGVDKGDEGLVSDRSGRTGVDGLYVVARTTDEKR